MMIKKTIALMLTLIMAVSVLPMAIMADEAVEAVAGVAPVEGVQGDIALISLEDESLPVVAEEAEEEAVVEEPAEEAEVEEPAEEVVEEPAAPIEYTVKFDHNYADCSKVDEVVVLEGETATAPEVKRIGWVLKGWFTKDEEGKKVAFDLTTAITADVVLYAEWEKVPTYPWTNIFSVLTGGRRIPASQRPQ